MKPINKPTLIILIIMITALTQAGLVLYTPAFLDISSDLAISPSLVKTTLTIYLFGFGISQLFYGPISDRIGRKKVLLTGLFIFSIGCFWSVFSKTYDSLFYSRLVQGIGIGSCMTLSRAIIRDCFSGKEYIKIASYLSSGFAIGLGLTPVIGGYLVYFFPWYAEFIFLTICGILLFISVLFVLPETHHQTSKLPLNEFLKQVISVFFFAIKDRSFICYLIGGVMAYGVVITYTTMAPFLFQQTLNFSPSFYGWLTFLIAIAYYIGTSINRLYVSKYGINIMMKSGLLLIFISAVFMLIAKLAFGLFNVYVTFIPLFVATLGQALIWSNSIAGALKDLSQVAGSAAALFGCLQMLLSALVSGIIAMLHEHNQIPIAITMIVLVLISFFVFSISVFRKTKT
ncbi:multidrug effflux MFS transporter [Thiotrichales bacterium 19X7-9]|nr:multidrug effflux MFS transporter [Thiotrichales bacterium 19X7-9]